jgi:tRNA-dihydrouridine synthase
MLQVSHGYGSKLVRDEPKTAHFDETLRFMTQAHAHIVISLKIRTPSWEILGTQIARQSWKSQTHF